MITGLCLYLDRQVK